MRALLDVNVLIALLDVDHTGHRDATQWMAREGERGWASCPLTQNGCIRVMSLSAYRSPFTVSAVVERLGMAVSQPQHEFWPDDVSLLDSGRIAETRVHGSSQLTDIYLLALAVAHGGRFVTLDRRVSTSSVIGARPEHLVVI